MEPLSGSGVSVASEIIGSSSAIVGARFASLQWRTILLEWAIMGLSCKASSDFALHFANELWLSSVSRLGWLSHDCPAMNYYQNAMSITSGNARLSLMAELKGLTNLSR